MPLYDFECLSCQHTFEALGPSSGEGVACPKCGQSNLERKPSLFRVGGRGDLRENTLHGCHEADPNHDHSKHSHKRKTG